MWVICNKIEAGVELFKQDKWTKLRDFILEGVTSDAACASGTKRKSKVRYFYHLAEPEDVIVQPSCAVLAVLTEAKRNRKNELVWSIVAGYEAIETIFDADRGRHVINRLCIGFNKGLASKEIRLHGLDYFFETSPRSRLPKISQRVSVRVPSDRQGGRHNNTCQNFRNIWLPFSKKSRNT